MKRETWIIERFVDNDWEPWQIGPLSNTCRDMSQTEAESRARLWSHNGERYRAVRYVPDHDQSTDKWHPEQPVSVQRACVHDWKFQPGQEEYVQAHDYCTKCGVRKF